MEILGIQNKRIDSSEIRVAKGTTIEQFAEYIEQIHYGDVNKLRAIQLGKGIVIGGDRGMIFISKGEEDEDYTTYHVINSDTLTKEDENFKGLVKTLTDTQKIRLARPKSSQAENNSQ